MTLRNGGAIYGTPVPTAINKTYLSRLRAGMKPEILLFFWALHNFTGPKPRRFVMEIDFCLIDA